MNVSVADRRQEIVQLLELEGRGHIVQLEAVNREALQLLVDEVPSTRHVLIALLALEPLADFLTSVRPANVPQSRIQPVTAWSLRSARGDDLDDIAVL